MSRIPSVPDTIQRAFRECCEKTARPDDEVLVCAIGLLHAVLEWEEQGDRLVVRTMKTGAESYVLTSTLYAASPMDRLAAQRDGQTTQ